MDAECKAAVERMERADAEGRVAYIVHRETPPEILEAIASARAIAGAAEAVKEARREKVREYHRNYYREHSAKNRGMGLRFDGKPRQRPWVRIDAGSEEERREVRRQRQLACLRRLRERRKREHL